MKLSAFLPTALAAAANAHAIFQRVSVNGQDQGLMTGVRTPTSNNPIQDVQASNFACNSGFSSPVSSTVIDIPAGAQVGAQYQHLIGGPQGSNDPDNPIAASHKGPIIVYLAEVDDAAAASPDGLEWFKIYEEGLSSGHWGVDTLLENDGWATFTMPSCVASGQYLMRVEVIALHGAYSQGGAQFYMSCAQINVTGGGSKTGQTVSFPGAYSANDPGILINIYGASGQPDNGGNAYQIPGPSVLAC
ncbi:Glycoside hydrolase family 61 [Lasiodiplodia theobromae]|uniref:Glycoside hydrolase family 61 n=1 Tax=Lasiodiplodia theobromae TaxID=45133 RepID=UPI0015C32BE9|nr:Glycoside hydrolase family 61 [Lasiodiplodia theobromae]KAF4545678.1 Glycoside hydrolase family 61 [Lasiodiplodia theobromae]